MKKKKEKRFLPLKYRQTGKELRFVAVLPKDLRQKGSCLAVFLVSEVRQFQSKKKREGGREIEVASVNEKCR